MFSCEHECECECEVVELMRSHLMCTGVNVCSLNAWLSDGGPRCAYERVINLSVVFVRYWTGGKAVVGNAT